MTPLESKLWNLFLRRLPIRFKRQKLIGDYVEDYLSFYIEEEYVVDFYCDKAKLVIEIDGGQHFEDVNHQKDNTRDKYLTSLGLKILRFDNHQMNCEFDAVCQKIYSEIEGLI